MIGVVTFCRLTGTDWCWKELTYIPVAVVLFPQVLNYMFEFAWYWHLNFLSLNHLLHFCKHSLPPQPLYCPNILALCLPLRVSKWDAPMEMEVITPRDRTLFFFKTIWTGPQGSQGCQKIYKYIKLLSSCAKIEPKLSTLQKTFKMEKKSCFATLFQFLFNLISILAH